MTQTQIEKVEVKIKTEDLKLEDLVSIGIELREKFDNNSWELGDLAVATTSNFGKEGLIAVATQIGVDIKTFRRYRDVAKAYPSELREKYKKLSFSHFKAVAARFDREAILLRADDEDWTIEKMMAMINPTLSEVIDDGKRVPARPEFKFCEVCRKWYIEDLSQLCQTKGKCEEVK